MEQISTIETVLTPEERNRYTPCSTFWLMVVVLFLLWGIPIGSLTHVLSRPHQERVREITAPAIMLGVIIGCHLTIWRTALPNMLREMTERNIIGWYRFSHQCTSTGHVVSEYHVGRHNYPFTCCPDAPRTVEPCGGLFPRGKVIWYGPGNTTKVIGTITFFRPAVHVVKKDLSGYVLYELVDERNQRGQYRSIDQILAHFGTVSG